NPACGNPGHTATRTNSAPSGTPRLTRSMTPTTAPRADRGGPDRGAGAGRGLPGLRDRDGRGARWVAEHEAGLASGLSNTALQTGTALGVAIDTTVAVPRCPHYLTAHKGANPLAAQAEGYQSAFLACAVLAGIGLALAFPLPGRPRKPARELPE